MISIDTTTMQSLASAATSTNAAIVDAMELLNRITTHNDWACNEKNAINEYTSVNKNRINQLHESSKAFLSAITLATSELEEAEKSIIDMFSSVEGAIAQVVGITVETGIKDTLDSIVNGNSLQSIGTSPNGMLSILKSYFEESLSGWKPDVLDEFGSFVSKTLSGPLTVCNFSDINIG